MINTGWYTVYLLMIALNTILCTFNGFNCFTWQYWAWSIMQILCFVAGANYKKE